MATLADRPDLHCVIVGGGPAGLTAAIYAARFRLRVEVVDAGDSRAALIPCTRNHAGFPEGISGAALLARMRTQAERYGAKLTTGRAEQIAAVGDGFEVAGAFGVRRAPTILIATGVTNRRPSMGAELHHEALARGHLRYCPVCDGFEVTDKRVAVIGTSGRGYREAMFLRAYTGDLSLVAPFGPHDLDKDQRGRLDKLGVATIDGPVRNFALEGAGLAFDSVVGRAAFDAVYPAMGSDVHSQLAASLGAATTDDGCLRVDAHQRCSLQGVYAAGDVVLGLDQISHAMGEAGVAATTIRNDLAERGLLAMA